MKQFAINNTGYRLHIAAMETVQSMNGVYISDLLAGRSQRIVNPEDGYYEGTLPLNEKDSVYAKYTRESGGTLAVSEYSGDEMVCDFIMRGVFTGAWSKPHKDSVLFDPGPSAGAATLECKPVATIFDRLLGQDPTIRINRNPEKYALSFLRNYGKVATAAAQQG